jgi:hypothetical protein
VSFTKRAFETPDIRCVRRIAKPSFERAYSFAIPKTFGDLNAMHLKPEPAFVARIAFRDQFAGFEEIPNQ